MKRPNYGKTTTYLIYNQRVWWCNKKREVNDLWKPLGFPIVPKLLSFCRADRSLLWSCGLCWEVYNCQQEEMWPSGELRFLHTRKNQLQMELAWFPGLWEEDETAWRVMSGNYREFVNYRSYGEWFYMRIYVYIYLLNCVFKWMNTYEKNVTFFSVKLRWLEQLILFFM